MDTKGGTFVLTARKGKSLSYRDAVAVIAENRKPQWVEITVAGDPARIEDRLAFKASVTGELFLLADDSEAKPAKKPRPFEKLQKTLDEHQKIVSVTGRVQEPQPNKGEVQQPKKGEKKPPPTIVVTGFEIAEDE